MIATIFDIAQLVLYSSGALLVMIALYCIYKDDTELDDAGLVLRLVAIFCVACVTVSVAVIWITAIVDKFATIFL